MEIQAVILRGPIDQAKREFTYYDEKLQQRQSNQAFVLGRLNEPLRVKSASRESYVEPLEEPVKPSKWLENEESKSSESKKQSDSGTFEQAPQSRARRFRQVEPKQEVIETFALCADEILRY